MSDFRVGDKVRVTYGTCQGRVGIVKELRLFGFGDFLMVKFRHTSRLVQKSAKNVTLQIPAHLRMDKGL